jgi:hypothetical protein
MQLKLFIGDTVKQWQSHELYAVHADDSIALEISSWHSIDEPPVLLLEEQIIAWYSEKKETGEFIFRTESKAFLRDYFGYISLHIQTNEQDYEIRFDVSIKKAKAHNVEEMIAYLAHKQNDIMRICLAHTEVEAGGNTNLLTDPEKLLNTAEEFINTLMVCRLELQHQLRKRLIPVKQPAWQAGQISDVDPFDIIFNLDALEPVIGEGDVLVQGRSFAIKQTEISALKETANVRENAILLGGLYSMRRVIGEIVTALNSHQQNNTITQNYHAEYESLSDVLLRVTSFKIKHRAEELASRLEEFMRYFEKHLHIQYNGELRPIMTPFVRASRVYKRLFEQLHEWYILREPSLNSRHSLAKLRSLSKLYEFVSLFKLIDYLYLNQWQVIQVEWVAELEFVPSKVIFQRDDVTLTLYYEAKIFAYSQETQHCDLVDMKHSRLGVDYNYWCPDFIIRLDYQAKTKYLILDAKYSTADTIKAVYLPSLLEKYFMNMAVYDAEKEVLTHEPIIGIIALYPDNYSDIPVYLYNWANHALNKAVVRLPIISGFPMNSYSNKLHDLLDSLFDFTLKQLRN